MTRRRPISTRVPYAAFYRSRCTCIITRIEECPTNFSLLLTWQAVSRSKRQTEVCRTLETNMPTHTCPWCGLVSDGSKRSCPACGAGSEGRQVVNEPHRTEWRVREERKSVVEGASGIVRETTNSKKKDIGNEHAN